VRVLRPTRLNRIVADYPADDAIHVVLDNFSMHKPKNDQWPKRHSNAKFRFIPTRASWLNQVEIWFLILERKSLRGASFSSVKQLLEHIEAFIKACNAHAVDESARLSAPFQRTSHQSIVIPV
jgi:transposase